jgi:hypothetical protein
MSEEINGKVALEEVILPVLVDVEGRYVHYFTPIRCLSVVFQGVAHSYVSFYLIACSIGLTVAIKYIKFPMKQRRRCPKRPKLQLDASPIKPLQKDCKRLV